MEYIIIESCIYPLIYVFYLCRLRGAKEVFYGAKVVHFKYTKNRMGSALEVQHPKYTSYK